MSGNESALASAGKLVLDATERATLDALQDLMIPASRDGRMPSAKSLGLYSDSAGLTPEDMQVFAGGLAQIEARALAAHGAPFAQLPAAAAMTIVEEMRAQRSEFIQTFMLLTTARYLQNAAVMPLIGLEARPNWPEGHVVAEGDWSLIEVVRKRPKIYREV